MCIGGRALTQVPFPVLHPTNPTPPAIPSHQSKTPKAVPMAVFEARIRPAAEVVQGGLANHVTAGQQHGQLIHLAVRPAPRTSIPAPPPNTTFPPLQQGGIRSGASRSTALHSEFPPTRTARIGTFGTSLRSDHPWRPATNTRLGKLNSPSSAGEMLATLLSMTAESDVQAERCVRPTLLSVPDVVQRQRTLGTKARSTGTWVAAPGANGLIGCLVKGRIRIRCICRGEHGLRPRRPDYNAFLGRCRRLRCEHSAKHGPIAECTTPRLAARASALSKGEV